MDLPRPDPSSGTKIGLATSHSSMQPYPLVGERATPGLRRGNGRALSRTP